MSNELLPPVSDDKTRELSITEAAWDICEDANNTARYNEAVNRAQVRFMAAINRRIENEVTGT